MALFDEQSVKLVNENSRFDSDLKFTMFEEKRNYPRRQQMKIAWEVPVVLQHSENGLFENETKQIIRASINKRSLYLSVDNSFYSFVSGGLFNLYLICFWNVTVNRPSTNVTMTHADRVGWLLFIQFLKRSKQSFRSTWIKTSICITNKRKTEAFYASFATKYLRASYYN